MVESTEVHVAYLSAVLDLSFKALELYLSVSLYAKLILLTKHGTVDVVSIILTKQKVKLDSKSFRTKQCPPKVHFPAGSGAVFFTD